MNAIVTLCHFCEAHGPRPLFCTFATINEDHTTESLSCTTQCNGCTSIGSETVFISRGDDGTIYCSRESIPNAEIAAFLRQAAIRSITCEVNWSKLGGTVYFSDTYGHVLSYTFQLSDTRARGLKRWFAVLVLMKENMMLLNLTPVLTEHMQRISKELQQLADIVYDNEQKICSQRALRLHSGRYESGQSRSLKQLTGNEDIFKILHSQFTWILQAGAVTYSETQYTSQDLLKKLIPKTLGGKGSIFNPLAYIMPNDSECLPIRSLENMLSKNVFKIMLYCVLTGTEIIIKLNQTKPRVLAKSLSRLLPLTNTEYIPHVSISEDNQSSVLSNSVCVLNETINNFSYVWTSQLPKKCPTMMNKIETAMCDNVLKDDVLHQHIKSLQLEWLGIAKAIKSAIDVSGAKSDAVIKLKKVLNVGHQDEQLLQYWVETFCT